MAANGYLWANGIAMAFWLVMILARFIKPMRGWADPLCGFIAPGLFAACYLLLLAVNIGGASGDMGTLAGVQTLFSQPNMLLIAWLHYLAFDLFVGGWISRTGDAEGVSPWLLTPILLLTLFFGPVGFVLFLLLRFVRRRGATVAA
ncbi:MAG: DUF4281 domain-containing protein [Caulobacter sp.]|nr:DUF4281 domain-containing protein [Caulobacter sp.]